MSAELMNASEYIHPDSAGDLDECRTVHARARAYLAKEHADGRIAGFHLMLLRSDEEWAEEILEDEWKRLVNARYPVVVLLVQPRRGGDAYFGPAITGMGFVPVR